MSARPGAGRMPRVVAGLGIALGVAALVLSQVANSRLWFHSKGRLHVWYHVLLFAMLGLLAMRSSTRAATRAVWLAFAVLLGFGIEYGEAVRFDDGLMEWIDVATDTLGVGVGAVAGWLMMRRAGGARSGE